MIVPEPTLADLRRELRELKRPINEDASPLDRTANGRWPMLYCLMSRIVDASLAGTPGGGFRGA